MAASYKTPGVYVEEIPKFPPSIAAVETAIPAFIGYTEKASRNGESLLNKPTRIESIAEYEEYFGGGASQEVTIELDTDYNFVSAEGDSKYFLYDSLRMFYANGGGNCYILSMGTYEDTISANNIAAALVHLEIEDEPTIILAPDAVSDVAGLYSFQQAALGQCNKLMDRVALCDIPRALTNLEFRNAVSDFRSGVGINNLKYGMAYGPWVKANLPRNLMLRDIKLYDSSMVLINVENLTTDTDILQIIFDTKESSKAVDTLKNAEPATKWDDLTKLSVEAFNTAPSYNNASNLYGILVKIIAEVGNMADQLPGAAQTQSFKLKDEIDAYVTNAGVRVAFGVLVANHNALLTATADASSTPNFELISDPTDLTTATALLSPLLLPAPPSFDIHDNADTLPDEQAKELNNATIAFNSAVQVANTIISFYRYVQNMAAQYEKQFNDALLNAFGTYKNLVAKAGEALNLLPPSGAIAGVYADTDRSRGVWKAPANVSLNAVVGPAIKISHEQQGEYNVDVNAGKSINIIRAFTGKGTLVWGARTLAGNDNEWRYVNVRRFFNFVEESVKKATEQFVFEPNDANTWVKTQAMIENFLTTLWRQGALQGVKPEHAFYVAVGLGKTMTPLDILEGRMIIEIGMAAVRPAEFIILKFSHKMAES